MKNMSISIIYKFLIITVITFVFSCSGKPKYSRKPVSRIKIENKQNKLVAGEDLIFSINTKVHNGELKKTEIFIDNELINTKTEISFSTKIENFQKVGKHNIRVVSTKKDGVVGTNYKSFEVISDIIPEKYTYKVVKTYPHDTKNFTEGLEIHNGFLYESTGENGASKILKRKLFSTKEIESVSLEKKYFGEGITIFNNKIYQLTYKAQKGFIYDLSSFAVIDSFSFQSDQGWGMTNDGENLIMSDGTNTLTYLNSETLKPIKKLQVVNNKGSILYLNELEYSDGYIYANIYTTENIVKIDTKTGKVVAEINCKGILGTYNINNKIDVFNGIAVNPKTNNIYVTGKFWPIIFEIELLKKE